jgi:WD40 repeat protein
VWDVTTGKVLSQYVIREGMSPVASNGQTVAVAAWAGSVHLLGAATGKLLRRGRARGIPTALSPDGKTLALLDDWVLPDSAQTIRLWDVDRDRERVAWKCPVDKVALSPDGKTLASSGRKTVRLWDAATGRELRRYQHEEEVDRVSSLAFSPDGKAVAFASTDHTVRLWDAATGKELRRYEAPSSPVVAFSPDGKRLATTQGLSVLIWALPQ